MNFEEGVVRHGGEQVHGEIVDAVRCDGQVMRLGQVGDLEPCSDATTGCDVGLGKGNPATVDHLLELVDRVQVLAGRQRHAAFASDARVALNVVRDRRLFEPEHVVLGKSAGGANRLVNTPAHVGVDQEGQLPEKLAHARNAVEILIQVRAPDFHLDGAKTVREETFALCDEIVEGEVQVDTAGVGVDPVLVSPEQPPPRLCRHFSFDVPQRDVDRRNCEHDRATPTDKMHVPPHLFPQLFDPPWVAADQQLEQVSLEESMNRRSPRSRSEGVAESLDPRICLHADGDQLEV